MEHIPPGRGYSRESRLRVCNFFRYFRESLGKEIVEVASCSLAVSYFNEHYFLQVAVDTLLKIATFLL